METFKVKMVDKWDGERYALTVAQTGQILSSTKDALRAGEFTANQVDDMSRFVSQDEYTLKKGQLRKKKRVDLQLTVV